MENDNTGFSQEATDKYRMIKSVSAVGFLVFSFFYWIAPIDIIPDVIPKLGYADDALIGLFGIYFIFRVYKKNRQLTTRIAFSVSAMFVILGIALGIFLHLGDAPVKKVKQTILPGQSGTVLEGINLLAGNHGEAKWNWFESEKMPGVKVVEVTVTKPDNLKVEYKQAKFQYILKDDTVQPSYMEFNGKAESLMFGAFKIQIMMNESANGK